MILDIWAHRWGVPREALDDLKRIVGAAGQPCGKTGVSEAAIQQQRRLKISKQGGVLWRNNVGVAVSETGQHIRYGLANDSKAMNQTIKSSDLIGITPHVVTQEDIGQTLGIFTSEEVKRPGWRFTGTPREQAQLAWLLLIISMGGIARFITSPEEV